MIFISICFISSIFLFMFFFISLISGLYFLYYNYSLFIEYSLFSINSCEIVMTMLLDWMSLLFMSFIFLISSMVVFYSYEYMSEEKYLDRFIFLVLLFVFSMILLVISPNMISILLGWDGLGLVSYCLVVYFQNVKSYSAGMLTALTNRIGDVAFLIAIAWMLNYGSWNYIFYMNFFDMILLIIMGFIFLAAITKSAQIPFSSWLPAAMAAPTPVSSLVHSSTLVTAGVYLLIRFNHLLMMSYFSFLLLLLGSLTMFMSGVGANYEFDLKKIIALSTLSQLGLMMGTLSLGLFKLAYFHMLTHAMFKALLFMCAGSVIHSMNNSQDIRFMGLGMFFMPFTMSIMLCANLALVGMPFLAGFYSSDLILESLLFYYSNLWIIFLFFFSTGLTVSYTFRLLFYLMISSVNFNTILSFKDTFSIMSKSMLFLYFMSIMSGSILSWLLFPSPSIIILPLFMKLLTLFICFIGGLMGYYMSNVNLFFFNKSYFYYFSSYYLGSMWFMPFISTGGFIKLPLWFGFFSFKNSDQGWSEFLGGQGMINSFILITQFHQIYQKNTLKIYLMLMVIVAFIWAGIFSFV
nr:NADH dehydrogenase subunit 5 [Systropus sp. 2 YXA-2022a]